MVGLVFRLVGFRFLVVCSVFRLTFWKFVWEVIVKCCMYRVGVRDSR